jgi:hypothetical protein
MGFSHRAGCQAVAGRPCCHFWLHEARLAVSGKQAATRPQAQRTLAKQPNSEPASIWPELLSPSLLLLRDALHFGSSCGCSPANKRAIAGCGEFYWPGGSIAADVPMPALPGNQPVYEILPDDGGFHLN